MMGKAKFRSSIIAMVGSAFFLAGTLWAAAAGAQTRMAASSQPWASIQRAPTPRPALPARPIGRNQARNGGRFGRSGYNRNAYNQNSLPCYVGYGGYAGAPLFSTYPSYGFTFAHQNAVEGNLAVKAAIDPVTQLELGEAARFGCETFGAGGYYILGNGYGYALPQEADQADGPSQPAQPQVIVLQQPPAATPPQQTTTAREGPAPPVPDEGQFVLVLRNGSQIQALAFMRTKDGLTYISTEGTRHTIALTDVDSNATIRVNEERGTPLKLPL